MCAQECLVSKVENICTKHFENTGGSPSWIVTNGKYQMKVPSFDSKRLDEALKNRKRVQIDFEWVEEDVNVGHNWRGCKSGSTSWKISEK